MKDHKNLIAKKQSVTKLLGTIAIGGTLAANLMACSPNLISNTSSASSLPYPEETFDFSKGVNGGQKGREETAEAMALLAESLVRPNTAVQAHQVAFRALEHNQYNLRAQLVLKTTAPLMELKGIYKRILPIVSVRPAKHRELMNHIRELQANKHVPDTVAFLLDGQSDLHTEGQAQDVVEKYVERTDELRDWLYENRKSGITVNAYEEIAVVRPCVATETSRNVWKLTNCKVGVRKHTGTMNMADFAAARQAVSSLQVYLAMATSYSVDGIFKASATLPAEGATAQQKYTEYSKIKGLGQLRNTKFFAMAPRVTSDFMIGLKGAKKLHTELCPKGRPSEQSRKGMLFNYGICVPNDIEFNRTVSVIEAIARAQVTKVEIVADDEVTVAAIDAKTFMAAPPTDLRNLGPVAFDKCGEFQAMSDGTGAGLFANGELNTVLAKSSAKNCR